MFSSRQRRQPLVSKENHMTMLARSLALAALLSAGGATLVAAQSLGDQLNSGAMSRAAYDQLISHTGLSADEAASKTTNEIFRLRAKKD
jgi:hypothetical protein